MDPAYYELTFSSDSGGGYRVYFRIYVELNDDDREVLRLGGTPELNTLAIVTRAGILRFLPDEINSDWLHYGRILSRDSRPSWDIGIEPQIGYAGRRVWIIGDA